MNNKELQNVANNSSSFSDVYSKLSACHKSPFETAMYVFTKLKSQSEYSIKSTEIFEISVKEFQRKSVIVLGGEA